MGWGEVGMDVMDAVLGEVVLGVVLTTTLSNLCKIDQTRAWGCLVVVAGLANEGGTV